MDVKDKYIPYEEYRLTFDRVIHTEDGDNIQIGFPVQCKMCFLTGSDKRDVAMELERLFGKMREAVMREME